MSCFAFLGDSRLEMESSLLFHRPRSAGVESSTLCAVTTTDLFVLEVGSSGFDEELNDLANVGTLNRANLDTFDY